MSAPRLPLAPVPTGVLPFRELASRVLSWVLVVYVLGGGVFAITVAAVEALVTP